MPASYDPNHVTKLGELYDFLTGIWAKCKNMFAAKSDLSTVATSGSYNDLSDKPTIPAAQVQSDWNQSDNTQVDFIKNKPSIPAAQIQSDWNQSDNTQVDFIKNKPSIPAAQVQSDWNQTDNTQVDFIKNKPSIPVVDQTYSRHSQNAQSGIAIEDELTAHYQKKIVIIDYNTATWAGVSAAFNTDSLIFLKDGSKYAILAYVSSSAFEFQYIQNTNETPWKQSKNAVIWKYSLNTSSSWTVTTAPIAFTPLGGNGIRLSSEYSDRSVTFNVDIPVYASGSNSLLFLGSNGLLVKSSAFSNTTVTNTFVTDKGGLAVYAKSYTGNTNRNIGNQYSANFSDSLTSETATIGFTRGTAVSMTFNANSVVKWDSSSPTSVAVGTGLAIKYGLFSISPKSITTSGNYAFALNLEPIKILDFGTVGTIAEGTTSLTTTPTVFAPASFNNITIEKGAKLATMFYSEVNGERYFYVNTRNPYGDTTISIAYDRTTSAATIVEEAPSDGKEYVRKNGAWVESSGAVETVLWSGTYNGSIGSDNFINLSQATTNFDRIKLITEAGFVYEFEGTATNYKVFVSNGDKTNARVQTISASFVVDNTVPKITCTACVLYKVNSANGVNDFLNMSNLQYNPEARLVKVIGIKNGVNLYNIDRGETVLYSTPISTAGNIVLSEAPSHFEKVAIHIVDTGGFGGSITECIMDSGTTYLNGSYMFVLSSGKLYSRGCSLEATSPNDTTWAARFWGRAWTQDAVNGASATVSLVKIVGINRIASN